MSFIHFEEKGVKRGRKKRVLERLKEFRKDKLQRKKEGDFMGFGTKQKITKKEKRKACLFRVEKKKKPKQ
jgi:hypothetical protein